MALQIGAVIAAKRRAKGWTQEQLADAVGVSSPAVSKWERGGTYPDITLLAPLAHALDATVDELLGYRAELSAREVDQLVEQAARTYETEGFEAGWALCQTLLREYPNSVGLKFHLGSLFQSFLMFHMRDGIGKEAVRGYYSAAAQTFEAVLAAKDPLYTYPATLVLVGYYALLGETDRAKVLLDSLPKMQVDPDQLYASLYMLQGKGEEGLKLAQQSIQKHLTGLNAALQLLWSETLEQGDCATALEIARANFEAVRRLDPQDVTPYPQLIESYIRLGQTGEAFAHFEGYCAYILASPPPVANTSLNNRLDTPPKATEYLQKVLAASVLMDERYTPLSAAPGYQALRQKLEVVAQRSSSAFDIPHPED